MPRMWIHSPRKHLFALKTRSLTCRQIAGPMWSGPLHETGFVQKVLDHLEGHADQYGTSVRMKGMLTVAKEVICLVALFSEMLMIQTGDRLPLLFYARKNFKLFPLHHPITWWRRVCRLFACLLAYFIDCPVFLDLPCFTQAIKFHALMLVQAL